MTSALAITNRLGCPYTESHHQAIQIAAAAANAWPCQWSTYLFNSTIRAKKWRQLIFSRRVRQVAHEQASRFHNGIDILFVPSLLLFQRSFPTRCLFFVSLVILIVFFVVFVYYHHHQKEKKRKKGRQFSSLFFSFLFTMMIIIMLITFMRNEMSVGGKETLFHNQKLHHFHSGKKRERKNHF